MKIQEEETYYNRTPADLYKIIETNFLEAKRLKFGRLDIRWSMWSAAMNRMIQNNLDTDKQKINYEVVFAYWQMLSILLELYYKQWVGVKFMWVGKINRQIKDIDRFKKAHKIGV